jgi:2-polyprenyl-3-methyl-5-hydroxy-6-metoxy-1,4-benzoquinol methylase
MKFTHEAETIIDEVLRELQSFDLITDEPARSSSVPGAYVNAHRHEYIRTVSDILSIGQRTAHNKVLEIGAFFGVVSIALARLGYSVTAADIPEFMEMPEQVERFGKNGVGRASVRLQDYLLPFEDESFDVVIMCEVIEHLNFNPLPLLKEINRIGKQGSVFYLSQPNLAWIRNRLRLLLGRYIQIGVDSFYSQLNPSSPEIVNGHWREYTKEDISRMLEPLGYRIERQYYFNLGETMPVTNPRRVLSRLMYGMFPSFKENLTTIAVRAQRTRLNFQVPYTVHPTLRQI